MVWLIMGYSAGVLLSLGIQKLNDYILLHSFAKNGYKLSKAIRLQMNYDDFKGYGNFIPGYNIVRNIIYTFRYATDTDWYIEYFLENDCIRKMTNTEQLYFDEKPSFYRTMILNRYDYPDEDLHDAIVLSFPDGSGFSYYVDEDNNYVIIEKFGELENKSDLEVFQLIADNQEIIDIIVNNRENEEELEKAISEFNENHSDKKAYNESDMIEQSASLSDQITELKDFRESLVGDNQNNKLKGFKEKIKKIGKRK